MFSKILNIAFVCLLTITITILLLARFSDKTGINVFIVKSGSMEPTIHTGAVIVTKKFLEANINDIITFKSPNIENTPVTHRVIDIKNIESESRIFTKGDANNAPDMGSIRNDAIIGTKIVNIPYLGYILSATKTRYGIVLLIMLPISIFILEMFKTKSKNENQ